MFIGITAAARWADGQHLLEARLAFAFRRLLDLTSASSWRFEDQLSAFMFTFGGLGFRDEVIKWSGIL